MKPERGSILISPCIVGWRHLSLNLDSMLLYVNNKTSLSKKDEIGVHKSSIQHFALDAIVLGSMDRGSTMHSCQLQEGLGFDSSCDVRQTVFNKPQSLSVLKCSYSLKFNYIKRVQTERPTVYR